MAEQVAALLKSRGETICVAETASGGLISASLLSTPGASKIFRGGLTLYTLESRLAFGMSISEEWLCVSSSRPTLFEKATDVPFLTAGWTQKDVDVYDGPTPELVEGLARNVRNQLHATWCVGESWVPAVQGWRGTAGPTASGKTPNRQPGYVALAVVSEKDSRKRDLDTKLGGDRQANMVAFASAGLQLVKEAIEASGGGEKL
ncbi:hypothetical protein H2200_004217 [Cladophialophora chaetospira]|uniref:CinA C-terminal domain-containing protein n=1 Tax=Cladophialophora chaetospira TaxID=386627 RepID=A0AA39CLG7_9EURO|nr:hypothetical protein H2200_004217 [Cladophialophora chaetospira]